MSEADYDYTGSRRCPICDQRLHDEEDDYAQHMQEHADKVPDIFADALRAIREYAGDNVSGATEDRGADTRWSHVIELVNVALRKAGAES